MKKIISLLTIVLIVTLLASCQIPGMGTAGGGNQVEDFKYNRLVIGLESLEVTDLGDIRTYLFNNYGTVTIIEDTESATDCEIVFGTTNRDITKKAKNALAKQLEKDDAECGYVIYAEGKNVAVYWTEVDMKAVALAAFTEICQSNSKLKFDEGIVTYQGYASKEWTQQKYWLNLEAQGCPPEVIAAYKSLNEYFSGSVYVEWMANLWDDQVGGFYYSSSARDNEPYLPDLESTNQLTNWLVSHKATGGLSRNDFLPNEMKAKIVKFVKDMQKSSNGYFLHPQWNQDVTKLGTDRVGRDLSWATDLISDLKVDTDGDGIAEQQYPNWCAPSGLKCEIHAGTSDTCNYSSATASVSGSGIATLCSAAPQAVTVDIRATKATAAQKVMKNNADSIVAVAVSSRPDYSSSEAFSNWLYEYSGGFDGMYSSGGKAHNINAMQDEIISKGFGDEVVAFLEDMQQQIIDYQIANSEEPTYLWNGKIGFNAVWGVLKYMPFYNSSVCGKKIDLDVATNMIKSCLKVVSDIEITAQNAPAGNDLMNMWSSTTSVISNVKKHYGQEEADKLYEMIRADAVMYINATIDKISHYRLDNGTFAYRYNHITMTQIYGVPICPGAEECDVNASVMFASLYNGVFSAMGYSTVPLCTEADGENFLRIVANLEPIEKIPVPKTEYDFENEEVPSTFSLSKKNADAVLEIAEDPTDPSNTTLFFKSGDGDPTFGDAVGMTVKSAGGNSFVFETDIYFKNMGANEDGKDIFQFKIGTCYMVTFGYEGKNVYLGYRTGTGGDAITKAVFASDTMGEDGWCNFRFEIYFPETNDDEELKVKYFLNGEYVGTDNHYWNQHSSSNIDTYITSLNMTSRKDFKTEIYLDNLSYGYEFLDYDANEHYQYID